MGDQLAKGWADDKAHGLKVRSRLSDEEFYRQLEAGLVFQRAVDQERAVRELARRKLWIAEAEVQAEEDMLP